MTSFVSSILHNSANKLESMSLLGSKHKNNRHKSDNNKQHLGSRLAMHASTPTLSSQNTSYFYQHPQTSHSTEFIPAPPPYDTMQQQQQQVMMNSPTPTPSTSWTSEMSALAEKIRDDVTNTFKGNTSKQPTSSASNIDRHSISQGMKLVSIAADEYEEGNETVALDIYLTGVDKILMALPNKTDKNTKMAIREKLQSVEERVGILNLATSQKKLQMQQTEGEEAKNTVNSFILSRIASTISTISSKAYQTATTPIVQVETQPLMSSPVPDTTNSRSPIMPTIFIEGEGDSMTRFKRLGQYMIDITVTCAILIKQSPLPDLVSFFFSYLIQLFLWFDAQYHVIQKAQDFGIQCIKLGLQADERYRLHEFVSEGLYMLAAAGLKAAIAFKETPRYSDVPSATAIHGKPTMPPPSPLPYEPINNTTSREQPSASQSSCLPQKARTSWAWSPW